MRSPGSNEVLTDRVIRTDNFPTVSVVIPAINEIATISSAVDRAWAAGASEVIVVDGGSKDGTLERLGGLRCQTIQSTPGRARQQNAGAKIANGAILLFLHADCWLDPGAIGQIERCCNETDHVWGAFRQAIDAAGIAYRLLELGNLVRATWLHSIYGDQGLWVRRDLFQRQGGFPEVGLLEDILLSRMLNPVRAPVILPGRLHVSARRWLRNGIVRQTIRNWKIVWDWRRGTTIDRLAERYRRHDQ